MNRVKHGALLALAAATIGSGCTTFSDNDAVARVDDEELSADELAELVVGPDDSAVATDANLARQAISNWISERLPLEPDAGQAPLLYPQGYSIAGSTCVQLMVTADLADAADTVSRLDAGDDYLELFAERNVDPTAPEATECLGRGALVPNSGNPLVDAALELTSDQPHSFVEVDLGNGQPPLPVVLRMTPYEELGPANTEIVIASLPPDIGGLDIYVDPRYGTFDLGAGVVPLG